MGRIRTGDTELDEPDGCVSVFAPVTLLTVTLERDADGADEVHIHAGGQGVWQARMIGVLGGRPVVCTVVGGESGDVIAGLLDREGFELHAVPAANANAVWIHDRRDGDRDPVWEGGAPALGRHEVDELYSRTLAAALGCGVCLLSGTHQSVSVLDSEVYARLCSDLRASEVRSVADLSGDELNAAIGAGIYCLKLSDEELERDGLVESKTEAEIRAAIELLHERGAENVVVSRAEEGALASIGGRVLRLVAPQLAVADARGAGDSMTAALALAIARRAPWEEALGLAAAAGAMNVTRHGSGSGYVETARELAERVRIVELGGYA